VLPGGVVVYDGAVVQDVPVLDPSVRVVPVPFSAIARALGDPRVKNLVALGALQGATGIFPAETFLTAIRQGLQGKGDGGRALTEEAFARGAAAAAEVGSSGSFGWWI
jgi:Pyruvate/2-oxoacid:ferredoxin oxidoreductase gamma subunit